MAFPKGHKRMGGIAKGQKQRRTLEWEAFGYALLANGLPRAQEILQSCDDDVFLDHFSKLLEYFKPKLARVEHDGAIEMKTVSETTIFQIKKKA